MTSPLLKITAYDSYKSRVDASINNLKEAALAHVRAVLELKQSGTWKETGAMDWPSYCKIAKLPFSHKTYSSYAPEIPFAQMIELISGAVPTANQARNIREDLADICSDSTLAVLTYTHAYRATGDVFPTEAALQEAYAEVAYSDRNGVVEIEGEQYKIDDGITQEIAYRIHERQQRQKMHIQSHAGEKEKVEIVWQTVVLDGQVFLCVPPDLQDRMPDTINVYLPVVKGAE